MKTWDYTVTEHGIKIEEVEGDEVIRLICELALGFEAEAEAVCDAHNKEIGA